MFRTASAFAVAALIGLVALRVAFGVMGGAVALLFSLAWLALKLICIGGAFYFALNVVSPASAKKIREFLGFDETPHAP